MSSRTYIAVDLGAGSGRVIAGTFAQDTLELEIAHRFPQPTCSNGGHDRWHLAQMLAQIERGLARAGERARERGVALRSLGVDSWAVDYGLLDESGELIEDPVRYRDARTDGMLEEFLALIPAAELYRRTGILPQQINTAVQLLAQVRGGEWPARARTFLMIPDLVHHHLCGALACERCNASTTQVYNASEREWDERVLAAIGVPLETFGPLVEPGTRLGPLRPELGAQLGIEELEIVCPATHDTACAVAATPLEQDWAYISSGTWSLVGIESERPFLDEDALDAGFTNEGGVFGTTRLLVNSSGLWILESCREIWSRAGRDLPHEELIGAIRDQPPGEAFIDPDDLRFLHPEDMVAEVRASLRERGLAAPEDPIALAKLILESLALRYAEIMDHLGRVTGKRVQGIHIVGGGSLNDFLNQTTANACGLPVRAGPVEATAIGNLGLQALRDGLFEDHAALRRFVARTFPPRTFAPADQDLWRPLRAAQQR